MKDTCIIEDCTSTQSAKNLCKRHYNVKWAAKKRLAMPEHSTYYDMKQRCLNPKNKFYHRYGGRGITVCERWLGEEGLAHFMADMGKRPDGYSINRIDNDGNYEPSNCEWSSSYDQGINRTFRIGASNEPNISWNKFSGSWLVRIIRNHKLVYSGRFKNIEDAVIARDKAKSSL